MTRESIMQAVAAIIAEHGNTTVGAGQRDEAVSTALNYAFAPNDGRELALQQRGLTDADLLELRRMGGTTAIALKKSTGGRNYRRERERRIAAEMDYARDREESVIHILNRYGAEY